MNATDFPEANTKHGPPPGLDESHVKTIPSFKAQIEGGPHDGTEMVVVAWRPTPEDLKRLNAGALVYLSMMGGLCPHFLSTSFKDATTL
jgi:hypothetical protein